MLEPAGRRRSRALPSSPAWSCCWSWSAGRSLWIASRTYTVEGGSQGTVRVAHGLPISIFGRELSVEWQDTGVSADAVRASEPDALSSSARGQGEAVGLAASLVWRYGVSQPPVIEAPAPPAPTTTTTDPPDHHRPVTLRTRELGFMIPAALLGLIGIASVASARSDTFDLGPVPSALGVLAVFLAMHLTLRLRARYADPYLLPTVGVLVAIGLVELDRISPALAADQAVWIAVGGVAFVATLLLLPDHRVLERYTYLIGLLGVGLLLATMIFGTRIYGAKLWIEIGGGQTVQLGEVSKILIVIFLAAYLRDKRELLAIPTGRVIGVPVPPMAALGPGAACSWGPVSRWSWCSTTSAPRCCSSGSSWR